MDKSLEKTAAAWQDRAVKDGEFRYLHRRPWRKHQDGCQWFYGDRGLGRGGSAPAYKVFNTTPEILKEFDEVCEYMFKTGKLRYLGSAMGDSGAIYEIGRWG